MTNSITIAIPVWNREDLILKAIDSAVKQQCRDQETIVVDNDSTDKTWEKICSIKGGPLKLFKNKENIGLFGNLNRCLELSGGKYTLILCSDDIVLEGWLQTAVEGMEADEKLVIVSTRGIIRDPTKAKLEHVGAELSAGRYSGTDIIKRWFANTAIQGTSLFNFPSGILLRTQAALDAGKFSSEYVIAGDVDLYLRMMLNGDMLVMDTIGCEIYKHKNQSGNTLRQAAELQTDLLRLADYFAPYIDDQETLRDFMDFIAAFALLSAIKALVLKGNWKKMYETGKVAIKTSRSPLVTLAKAARLANKYRQAKLTV